MNNTPTLSQTSKYINNIILNRLVIYFACELFSMQSEEVWDQTADPPISQ